jgi:exopolyphosphatase/guanosine-5'-triphosphate,3'-diphosphate pyrophosphatase
MQRYHVDALQARRVGALALNLYRKLAADDGEPDADAAHALSWASRLHEIGISVAFSGYHKHSAYIIGNADMPGFSRDEQTRLALLVQAHRRSLGKAAKSIDEHDVDWGMVFSLRLAALLHRSRADAALPPLQARRQGKKLRLTIDAGWLARNPLTVTALHDEIREWDRVGFELKIPGLEEPAAGELALAS